MAKLLVGSLLRTRFSGDILVFSNAAESLFQIERSRLREVFIATPEYQSSKDYEVAWRYKYRVRKLFEPAEYDKILFLDADCLALGNLDGLLEGDWDIGWYAETDRSITLSPFNAFLTDAEVANLQSSWGANSGILAVRGKHYSETMKDWERIDMGATQRQRNCSDQASWNRLLIDTPLRKKQFADHLIKCPLFLHPSYHDWKHAHLVHAIGGSTREKMQFLWGLYMQRFYFDDGGTMLSCLDV